MFLYTMESVNLICGDHDAGGTHPGTATYLTLRQLQLPNLEENYVEHVPGGGVSAFEVYTHLNRLQATFTLSGWQPEIIGMLNHSSVRREAMRYTAYGVVREQRTGLPMKAIAIMWGRMGSVNPSAFRRGDLQEIEYSIKGMQRYRFRMQKNQADPALSEIFYWDFFENTIRVNGIPVRDRENAILGISGTPYSTGPETYTV